MCFSAEGIWDAENPYTRSIGTVQFPINKMLAVAGKLWCGCQNVMKVINPLTLSTEVRSLSDYYIYHGEYF